MQPDDVVEASHTTRGGVRPPATRLAFLYRKTVLPIATRAARASNLKPLVAFKFQEIVWLQGKMHPPQWKCKATSGLANGTIPEYPTPFLLNLVHKLY